MDLIAKPMHDSTKTLHRSVVDCAQASASKVVDYEGWRCTVDDCVRTPQDQVLEVAGHDWWEPSNKNLFPLQLQNVEPCYQVKCMDAPENGESFWLGFWLGEALAGKLHYQEYKLLGGLSK